MNTFGLYSTSVTELFVYGASMVIFALPIIYWLFVPQKRSWFRIFKVGSGFIFLSIPRFIPGFWVETFSSFTTVWYYLFILVSVWGGEVVGAYGRWFHFDSFLHTTSGTMMTLMTWELLSRPEIIMPHALKLGLSFSVVMAIGSVWEIYEYTGDHIGDLNMQRYRSDDGRLFVGHEALFDTMKDIMCNATGSVIALIIIILLKL